MIRLASTVMMLRPSADGFEVFMLRRSAKSAFAPDVFVFPGGAVDDEDYGEASPASIDGLDEKRLARMFRAQAAPLLDETAEAAVSIQDARALVVAALRETFEEAGVLLGARAIARLDQSALHRARANLLAGSVLFGDLLASLDVRLDASQLEFFSQWITPPSEGRFARRFNAHFFVARADAQHAIADRLETHDEIWLSPKTALERFEAGSYAMVYPTIKHIERLAQFGTLEDVMAFAKEKPILRIMPNATTQDGFTLPDELELAW